MKLRGAMAGLLAAGTLVSGCLSVNVSPGRTGGGVREPGGGVRGGPSAVTVRGAGPVWSIAVDWDSGPAVEDGYLFYAYDTLARPGEPVLLAARLVAQDRSAPVQGATVGFYFGQRQIGSAQTDATGLAQAAFTPGKAGDYPLTARLEAPPAGLSRPLRIEPTPLLVAARARMAGIVVIYANDTLVDGGFGGVLSGRAPMPGAPAACARIAASHTLVYSVNREYLMHRRAKAWLANGGFPPGPILLNESVQGLSDSGRFKTSSAALLCRHFPAARVGVAEKDSVVQDYLDNGLTTYMLLRHKDKAKDLRKAAERVREFRNRRHLHVVGAWEQIEAAVLRGQAFPAEAFITAAEARARQLDPRGEDD